VTKTGGVFQSTKPGNTTRPEQSTSCTLLRFLFSQGSRRASLVVPTETIFPLRHRTAPFSIMPRSFRSRPRRGPGLPEDERRVRSWPMLMRRRGLDVDDVRGALKARLIFFRHLSPKS